MTESPECFVRWEGRRPIDVASAREVWRDLQNGPDHDEGCLCPSCKRKLHQARGGRFSRETFFYSWLELEAKLSLVPQKDYTIFRPRPLADEERTSVEWADFFSWIPRCSGFRRERDDPDPRPDPEPKDKDEGEDPGRGAKRTRCPDADKCIHARFTKKLKPPPSEWEGATERPRRGPRPKTRRRAPTTIRVIAAFLKEHFPDLDANPAHIQLNLWRYRKAGIEAALEEEIKARKLRAMPPDPSAWQNLRLAQHIADFVYKQPGREGTQRELQRGARVLVGQLEELRTWLLINYGIEARAGRRKGQVFYRGRMQDARGRVLRVGVGLPTLGRPVEPVKGIDHVAIGRAISRGYEPGRQIFIAYCPGAPKAWAKEYWTVVVKDPIFLDWALERLADSDGKAFDGLVLGRGGA